MPLDVTDLIANLLGALHADAAENLCFWSEEEITRFFDEAVKRHARKAGVYVARDTTSITLVQGTAVYTSPARHLATLHVALARSVFVPSAPTGPLVEVTRVAPLVAASSSELELLDDNYKSTQGTPQYWYADKEGANKIGFYPVPDADADGLSPELIFYQLPAELDEDHGDSSIPAPAYVGDYLEAAVLGECYGKEGDARMPEVAAAMRQLAALYEQMDAALFGASQ